MRRLFPIPAAWGLLAAALLLAVALGPSEARAQDAAPCGDTVTIAEGDTLYAIAATCNTTVDELLQANPGINPLALQIGSTIFIPGAVIEVDIPPRVVGAPVESAPGENVLLLANGFPPGTELTLTIGPAEGDAVSQETAVANDQGAFQATLLLPEDLPAGSPWEIAVEAPDGESRAVFPVEEPTAAIWPTSGGPGTAIQVLANGFPPGAEVEIAAGPWQTTYSLLTTAAADESGTVDVEVTLPALATFGEEWVFVLSTVETQEETEPDTTAETEAETGAEAEVQALTDTRLEATTGLFDVTEQGASPAPAGQTLGRATIYLVALEDAGASGEAIGCGDSLVPVEVEVGAADSTVQAALENLLSIRTQQYGESGLYNALYQSELAVESVDISGGTAVVNLSGTLRLGGVCDAPRVEMQLTRTAQQDPALTDVQINVNGQPLESLLTEEG